MTGTATPQVVKAVIVRLRALSTLTSIVTGIHDQVPQDRQYPYVVVDEIFEVPERTFGENGHRVFFSVFVYTRDGSETRKGTGTAGFKSGLDIAELIVTDLTSLSSPMPVDNHVTVDVDIEGLLATRDEDSMLREVECQFSAWLEDV